MYTMIYPQNMAKIWPATHPDIGYRWLQMATTSILMDPGSPIDLIQESMKIDEKI